MPTRPCTPGQRMTGFTVLAVTPLPEINATLIRLRHEKTGARMVHVATEDPNNLFGVGFRTPPEDSTGVAHILEHTVLCGSKRYPVRDPFFAMLKRSLNTFMNALTSSDWTFYPFATQNRKDFYNLMGIYLDATFFPILREMDFSQEGHRLEFAEGEDASSPLVYKGVVYNEMKGAMSDPSSLLYRRMARALYPATCYRHNSGGEPSEIPSLGWDQLREFHASHYHPSNAYFFTYGNLPLEEHLAVIDKEALCRFEPREVHSAVPPEERLDAPKAVTETYALDPAEPLAGRTLVHVGWLACDITDSLERMALNLLSTLLLGNPAAPLYKALLDSGLGRNLTPGCGYHDDNRTTYFAAGLQGTDPEKAEQIEQLILDTLEEAANTGFSPERVEGALHRLEFAHREVGGDHYPYPLVLLMRALGPWLHNDDPVSPLQLDQTLAALRQALCRGPFLQDLIRRRLLNNPHRVRLTLRPDHGQKEREETELAAELERVKASLTPEQTTEIVERARLLRESQEREEDLSCLPTLALSDIPPEETAPVPEMETLLQRPLILFDQPTNGINYFCAHLPTDEVPEEMLPLLPIFSTMLTKVGASGHSYLEMAERIEAGTGGVHAGVGILEAPAAIAAFHGVLEIKGKALVRKQGQLFNILGDILTAPDFSDLDRLRTVIGQTRTSLENSIPGSGHSYAARAAAARLCPGARRRENWSGISQIRLVKRIADGGQAEMEKLSRDLQTLGGILLDSARMRCSITGERAGIDSSIDHLEELMSRMGARAQDDIKPRASFTPEAARLGWATSVPVSFVTRVFPTVCYTHPDAATLMVLAKLMRAGYLHRELREKGGAYGGLANADVEGGTFSMLSYRDPHLVRTLGVFDDAVDWAASGRFGEKEITEAVLAVFGDIDRPLSPGGRGNREFANLMQGLTVEMRQQMRERILAVGKKNLMDAAELYLGKGRPKSVASVVSSEKALLEANKKLGDEALTIERI